MLGKQCRGRHNNKLNRAYPVIPGLMLVHRLHCWPNIKLTLSRCSFCRKYSVYSQCNILSDYALYYYHEAIPLEYNHTCLAVELTIFGLAKLLKLETLEC